MAFKGPFSMNETMILFLQFSHQKSTKMQFFVCIWKEYTASPLQHQLFFHQYLLLCSGFVSPFQTFPTSLLDSLLFNSCVSLSCNLAIRYSFWGRLFHISLNLTSYHCTETTVLIYLGCFTFHVFCLFPVLLIFFPKGLFMLKTSEIDIKLISLAEMIFFTNFSANRWRVGAAKEQGINITV